MQPSRAGRLLYDSYAHEIYVHLCTKKIEKKICTSAKSKTPENTEKEDILEKKFKESKSCQRDRYPIAYEGVRP